MMNSCSTEPLVDRLQTSSITYLCLLGFLVSYFLFFIYPVFLNSDHQMFTESVIKPWGFVGSDLKRTLGKCESWWFNGVSPTAIGTSYPPLTYILLVPFLYVNFHTAYIMSTVFTILSYLFVSFLIPLKILKAEGNNSLPLVVLFSVTGAFSYGFQFELERGQFNVIVFFFSLLAIYLYNYSKKYWYISYFVITLAIQLKIYPLIFLIFMVGNWRDWKAAIARLLTMLALNLSCLFILGTKALWDYLGALSRHSFSVFPTLVTNHSIKSFSGLFPKYGERFLPMIPNHYLSFLDWFFQTFLFVVIIICLGIVFWSSFKEHREGIDPTFFLVCTLAACLIPSESNDYKLPLLTAAVLLFLTSLEFRGSPAATVVDWGTALVIALAYSTTLYSPAYRPLYLTNSCPILMIILVTTASYALLRDRVTPRYSI